MKDLSQKMQKVFENLKDELVKIRTSRASAGLLEGILVTYYGKAVPIKSCAAINTPDSKTIEIHPWEASQAPVISNAILKANIGITPQAVGDTIRLTMPAMTVERRGQVAKIVHNISEEHKVSIRNLRRKKMELISKQEKNKEIAKDEKKALEKEIQKLTDEIITKIDETCKKRETEIMNE